MKIRRALKPLQEAIDEFRQDDRIDAADMEEFSGLIKGCWRQEVYSEEEEALLQRVCQKFEGSLEEIKWKRLNSPDTFVKMDGIFEEGRSTAMIGRAVTIVDASIEECAAWEHARMSRKRMKEHHNFGGLEKSVVKLTNHSELYYLVVDLGGKTIAPREWLTKVVWKMVSEDTMMVGFEDTKDNNFPPGAGKGYVRASSGCLWKYERLPEVLGIPQTRVTYTQQVDLKGFIPSFVMNSKLTETLKHLSNMRKKFDKSLEIDAGRRAKVMQRTGPKEKSGRAEALAQFEALFKERPGSERPSRSFTTAGSMVKVEAVSDLAWGATRLDVRASIEEVAAFLWDFGSRANIEISGDVERNFEDDVGGSFKRVVKRSQQLDSMRGSRHRDRTFSSELTLQKVDKNTIILLLNPVGLTNSSSRLTLMTRARKSIAAGFTGTKSAREIVGIKLKRIGERKTNLEYACELELGFGVSRVRQGRRS